VDAATARVLTTGAIGLGGIVATFFAPTLVTAKARTASGEAGLSHSAEARAQRGGNLGR